MLCTCRVNTLIHVEVNVLTDSVNNINQNTTGSCSTFFKSKNINSVSVTCIIMIIN